MKNEIDYVSTNKRQVSMDVSVFNIGIDSDHRMIRAKIKKNHKTKR